MGDDDSRPQMPAPPGFAVIFRSQRTDSPVAEYEAIAARMLELARRQPGFLDVVSYHDSGGQSVTISYWSTREAIDRWREHAEHRLAQQRGRAEFYSSYVLEVCQVERITRMPPADAC